MADGGCCHLLGCFTADDDKQRQLGHDGCVILVSPGAFVTESTYSAFLCCKMNVNPLKLPLLYHQQDFWSNIVQEIEWCVGETKGGTLSQSRESRGNTGHLASKLPEISVLECLPLEVGWKHHLITAFLKEEHKGKTMLAPKKEKILRLREQPQKFIKGTAAKCTGVWSSRVSQAKPSMSIKIVPKQL